MKIYYLFLIAIFILSGCAKQPENDMTLASPDNRLRLEVEIDDAGRLLYSLNNADFVVIEKSPLGIVFDKASFKNELSFVSSSKSIGQTDSYTMITGKRKENNARWNEMRIVIENTDNNPLELIFRLFDTGLAFSYAFDHSEHREYTIKKELTGFRIPDNSVAWMHAARTNSNYETFYQNRIPVGTASPEGMYSWAFPLLFQSGDHWTLITETDVQPGYAGMYIDGNPDGNLYTMLQPGEDEAFGLCSVHPTINIPSRSPWRVIITGTNPGVIVESNLVFDLSKPNALGDISWIEPGRSAWSWWSENDSPQDFNRLKEYVDFTRQMGWEYFLVDANWNRMQGGSLQELTEYANSVGVRIQNWYNSGGPHNDITEEPRDLMHIADVRREEFRRISEWGIKGIKVDFFLSDKACIMQQYHDILKDAADFKLLVNVHGSTLPRGWERTYPNLMTMESVRGAEYYIFDVDYPEFAPWHNTILPFTRNVVGSMDYTPVTFSDSEFPKKTTHAHELALAVVFESGLKHFADSDQSYLSQPDYVIEYLKIVPATWDETKFVSGYPGETVVIARRSGNTWYISGINGTDQEKSLDIDTGFLSKGRYSFQVIGDGENPQSFRNEMFDITGSTHFTVNTLPRGGFSAVLMQK